MKRRLPIAAELWFFVGWLFTRVVCLIRGHAPAEEAGAGKLVPMNRAHKRRIKKGKAAAVRHTHKKLRCSRCKKRLSKDVEA